jgi:hypothetical protein
MFINPWPSVCVNCVTNQLIRKKHYFKLVRTRKELCGNCHQEQTGDLNTIPTIAQLRTKAPQVGKTRYLHKPLEEENALTVTTRIAVITNSFLQPQRL